MSEHDDLCALVAARLVDLHLCRDNRHRAIDAILEWEDSHDEQAPADMRLIATLTIGAVKFAEGALADAQLRLAHFNDAVVTAAVAEIGMVVE